MRKRHKPKSSQNGSYHPSTEPAQGRPKKICLLGASFETCNMGVSALAEASIKCMLNRWPDARVVLLGSSREAGTHRLKLHGREVLIPKIPVRLCKNIFTPNHFCVLAFYALVLRLLHRGGLKKRFMRRNPFLRLVLRTDLFVDISGGDSFSDIYGMRRFLIGFPAKLVPVLFGKRLVTLPQTYGPFNRRLTKVMARFLLRRASIVYSRDRAGAEYVNSLLNSRANETKVRFAPDVAFVLDARRPSRLEAGSLLDARTEQSVLVGLNVSGLLYYGGYTGNNMFGLHEDYRKTIVGIVEFLMTRKDVLVLLVPHVFPPSADVGIQIVENDVAACHDVYEKLHDKYPSRLFMVRGSYDQGEIKYIIGLCDFFLGSRMHACVAALSQMIPAVGLAYSKKFSGVFESVDIGNLVIDLRTATQESILRFVERAFSEREASIQKLSQTIPKGQETILEVFSIAAGEFDDENQ
jgi:polysaccharide pyruvyl transferase WcaK-like protein